MDVILTQEGTTVYEGDQAPEPPGWIRLAELEGRQVDTPGGTRIGKVGDVALDEEGRITGFSLTSLSVKGPVAEAEGVARSAVVDVGAVDGVMTIELARAEKAPLEVDPDLLFSQPMPTEIPQQEEESSGEPGSFEQG
jgi:sporulation protein YlmC with PRC-barrel domain